MERLIELEQVERIEYLLQLYKADRPINQRLFPDSCQHNLAQLAEEGLVTAKEIIGHNGEEGHTGYTITDKGIKYVEKVVFWK